MGKLAGQSTWIGYQTRNYSQLLCRVEHQCLVSLQALMDSEMEILEISSPVKKLMQRIFLWIFFNEVIAHEIHYFVRRVHNKDRAVKKRIKHYVIDVWKMWYVVNLKL